MSVRKRDRCRLPGEDAIVTIRAVDADDEEVTLAYERADGTKATIGLSPGTFAILTPLYTNGTGDPPQAMAALWGYWMTHVTVGTRQATLATTPLRAYAHQDDAVYGAMLPQPTLRFLLADEPGTGKTLMTGMYISEMRRLGLLRRVLLVVPAHLVTKWEQDLLRFFGLRAERLTAEVGRSVAPLRPDQDIWVSSVDLLARNPQVQRKALLDPEGAWDLSVCDEAHRLTPTAQTLFDLAVELARRSTHLLLLTATPHRGNEYMFRGLLHLLDPAIYPWSEDDKALLEDEDVPRLRPAATHFLRRMKEGLRDYDGVTPLFPPRRAHNIGVHLSATEQQIYDDALTLCDGFVAGAVGMVRSVYGKRGASSLYALARTLDRRAQRLARQGQDGTVRGLAPVLTPEDLEELGEDEGRSLDDAVTALASTGPAERADLLALVGRIDILLADPTFTPAKWERLRALLREHGIVPGANEQVLVFTEYADTATWLTGLFSRVGFAVQRYAGDVPSEARDRIQADFQAHRFEVLVATDAGNEGIDLQSAHVLINWDIPWSIVRLEQRAGRLHRIGQQSRVDIYNLISTSTREGRVQEVILGNIVAAANALNGQIFDCLGSVVEQIGLRYTNLLSRAGASEAAALAAAAEARRVTANQYKSVTQEMHDLEDRLATPVDALAFAAHQQRDRLDDVNPAIVEAFVRALAVSYGWRMDPGLHDGLFLLDAGTSAVRLPQALRGGQRAQIATSAEALVRARDEGADLGRAIVLGPAEDAFRQLATDAVRDGEEALLLGARMEDPGALTAYELLIYDAGLTRRHGGRPVDLPVPLLVRADGGGCRAIAWQAITHLQPAPPEWEAPFTDGILVQAEVVARVELDCQEGALAKLLRAWTDRVDAQLDRLQEEVTRPYMALPAEQRRARRAAVAQAIAARKAQVRADAFVEIHPPRLVGRIQVRAGANPGTKHDASDAEVQAMLLVAQHLGREGFDVDDVHQEGCGYDLRAHRPGAQRCIEVKGLSGDISLGVHLEASEWLMAQQLRQDYWLYVVVDCATGPRLFGAYRNPLALFGGTARLVQRFHVPASALRKAPSCV